MIRAGLLVAALALPATAGAQAYKCAVPERIDAPRHDGPSPREPKRVVPIGGYTLALTWAPQYCHANARDASARFQCASGNRFGFTLHGLWPDGKGREWPQYCAPAKILDADTIRRNLCATPSAQLLQHEYAKHGTCMGIPPRAYFERAGSLYARVRYPDMDSLSRREKLTAGQFAAAFARVNRGLTAEMLRITANRQGWLDEVWVCLDTRFAYTRCPSYQKSLPAARRLKIWRGAR